MSTGDGKHVHDVVVNGMVFESLELSSKVMTMLQDAVIVLLSRECRELVSLGENKSGSGLDKDLSLFRVKLVTLELVPETWESQAGEHARVILLPSIVVVLPDGTTTIGDIPGAEPAG